MCKDISFLAKELSKNNNLESYIKVNCNKGKKYFYEYLVEIIKKNEIKMSSVVLNSRINKNYVYNIVNGNKLNPSRDKIIALCIGGHLTVSQTCISLEIAGYSRLRIDNERDLRLAVLINDVVKDVFVVNKYLTECNLQPLEI